MSTINGGSNNIDQMRSQALDLIRRMRENSDQFKPPAAPTITNTNEGNFSKVITNAVNQVNEMQNTANAIKQSYELGDKSVSLTQVSLASQEASIGFKLLLTMRNRAIEAYKSIMDMPV